MAQQPIAIISAGIAGLTLARCLRQRGVPTVLLDKATSSPRHSYGITLHPWAYRPLLQVLDMDEPTFRRRVAVDGHVGGSGRIGPEALAATQADSLSFRAHRAKFEDVLREGLDVRWEHVLTEVKDTPKGVLLGFENGQQLETSLAVSTEGVHSHIRQSLLPESKLNILSFVVFNGKRRMSQDSFRESYAPYLKGKNVIELRKDEVLLQLSLNDNGGDVVSISYTYSRPARKDDALHKPDRSTAAATDVPEEFYSEIAGLRDLERPFSEVFDVEQIKKDRVLHWLMRSVLVTLPNLQELSKRGVVLIGDAAHAMPILGGLGANAAVRDGVELAKHIGSHGDSGISDWYEAKYDKWSDEVRQSEKTLAAMHSDQKSVL